MAKTAKPNTLKCFFHVSCIVCCDARQMVLCDAPLLQHVFKEFQDVSCVVLWKKTALRQKDFNSQSRERKCTVKLMYGSPLPPLLVQTSVVAENHTPSDTCFCT